MFSVYCKDPLESEKVGHRRDRKGRGGSATPALSDDSSRSRPPSVFMLDSPPLPAPFHNLPTPISSPALSDPRKSIQQGREYFPFGAFHGSELSNGRTSVNPERPDSNYRTTYHSTEDTSGPQTHGDIQVKDSPRAKKNFFQRLGFSNKKQSGRRGDSRATPISLMTDSSWGAADTMSTAVGGLNMQSGTTRFHRMLRKIEMTKDMASCERLAQQWDGDEDDDDMEAEFHFETALWAIVGAEKIRATARPMRMNPHSGLEYDSWNISDIRDGMHVLYLGSTHDSPMTWYLGAKYPGATFHCLGVQPAGLDLSSSSWGMPPNVESSLWTECPRLSLPASSYDMVIVQDLFHVVRCTDWTILIPELLRVLTTSGILAVSLMDPLPKRAGPLLEAWTRRHLEVSLAQRFMVPQPSLMAPFWIEENAHFSDPVLERLEYSCHRAFTGKLSTSENTPHRPPSANGRKSHSYTTALPQIREHLRGHRKCDDGSTEALLDSWIGYHLFRNVYRSNILLKGGLSMHEGPRNVYSDPASRLWWWNDREILDECRRFDTAFETQTFFYIKS